MSEGNGNAIAALERLTQVGGSDVLYVDPTTGEQFTEAQAAAAGRLPVDLSDPKIKGRKSPKTLKAKRINLEAQAKGERPAGMAKPYDPEFEDRYPNLFELLTMAAYSDGTERILPTLVIGRQPGCYTATLQDHEMMRQCRASSATMGTLYDALESGLLNPLAWTYYRSRINKKGEPFSLRKKKPGQSSS